MVNFHSGQKVICVDAREDSMKDAWLQNPRFYSLGLDGLTEGKVYTIQRVGLWGQPLFFAQRICVTLYEIDRIIPYDARRFRPVVEKKTSIEVFQTLLNKTPELVENVK